MNDDEFNALLEGPLHHPMVTFQASRLAMALRHVVNEGGVKAVEALRDWCKQRQEMDTCE